MSVINWRSFRMLSNKSLTLLTIFIRCFFIWRIFLIHLTDPQMTLHWLLYKALLVSIASIGDCDWVLIMDQRTANSSHYSQSVRSAAWAKSNSSLSVMSFLSLFFPPPFYLCLYSYVCLHLMTSQKCFHFIFLSF